jgi:hypothetical protein
MSERPHPILQRPWTYKVVSLQVDFPARELCITLCREEETVTLRFLTFEQLSVDEGYVGSGSGMEILDLSDHGLETARVRVQSFEQDPAIRFWARDVERVQS